MAETTLGELLDPLTIEGDLYETLPDGAVRCYACGHRCLIKQGRRGICKVRFNQDGRLRVPWGYVSGLQSDPVEKKPFYHFLPGSEQASSDRHSYRMERRKMGTRSGARARTFHRFV